MKSPKVSVLMPAYNVEKYIGEAIDSVLNQTFTDFEFIIINDGSTDNTAKIIKQYAKKDKRIRFIDNHSNLGISRTRNNLLSLSNTEYIAYLDSDDRMKPNRLAIQYRYMESHPDVGVLGTAYQCFGVMNKICIMPKKVCLLDLLKGCFIGNPTVMMRKSILVKNGISYNEQFQTSEDYELWTRLIRFTNIYNLSDVLTEYRVQNTSLSHNNPNTLKFDKQIKDNILNFLSSDKNIQNQILNLGNVKTGFLLPKWLGRLCCWFIPKRSSRHIFKEKYVK